MGIRSAVLGLIALGLACAPAAFAQQAATPPVVPAAAPEAGPTGPSASTEYLLGPDDTIDIEVVGQPDRTRAHVYSDGTIQMNLVGKVSVAGKTTRQLGAELAAALKAGGYFSNPVVNVEVSSYASRYVTVLGAVGTPGLVPINRSYKMSEIIARVGGIQERAADYLIVRPETGPEKRYMIEKLATGDSTDDPYVTPGDKIFIPVADVFYISGQVANPGSFPMKSGMTLREAIARAGGLTDSGTDKGVKVTRGGKTTKMDASTKVQANDVLVVRERLF
ncbi:MAG TPA: polysaccharide biosynthesis/export family protein [Phenylobacterium sp.]|nr:polysaccharide biosynthesis/export family protein [Phenylobacterium sp.]